MVTSEIKAEVISELFQPLKLFQNYFSHWNYFKIISTTLNTLKNIH